MSFSPAITCIGRRRPDRILMSMIPRPSNDGEASDTRTWWPSSHRRASAMIVQCRTHSSRSPFIQITLNRNHKRRRFPTSDTIDRSKKPLEGAFSRYASNVETVFGAPTPSLSASYTNNFAVHASVYPIPTTLPSLPNRMRSATTEKPIRTYPTPTRPHQR